MNEKGFSLRTSPYLHTRGMVHLDLQKYAEAERDFTTAVDQYSQLGNLRAQASETYHAGIAIALQQRPAEAEARFTRAERIQREINDRPALANTLLFKGKICLPLQKRDNMIAYFQEAIGILKELGMFERAQESIDELNYYLEP
jgi:tetratricopeptide (TPR) repeat protein